MDSFFGTATDWQTLISKLNDVYASHVVFSEANQPVEIHILASDKRSPKAIVRDVQSALSARYGVDVDYHIISVAQISDRLPVGPGGRLTYAGFELHTLLNEFEVTVTLSRGGVQYAGKSSGSTLPFARKRAIALATLDAVKAYTGGTSFFELGSIDLLHSGGRQILITQVYCVEDCKPLIGCVYADQDADAAVAQSVLDAINRKLEIYTQGE